MRQRLSEKFKAKQNFIEGETTCRYSCAEITFRDLNLYLTGAKIVKIQHCRQYTDTKMNHTTNLFGFAVFSFLCLATTLLISKESVQH